MIKLEIDHGESLAKPPVIDHRCLLNDELHLYAFGFMCLSTMNMIIMMVLMVLIQYE